MSQLFDGIHERRSIVDNYSWIRSSLSKLLSRDDCLIAFAHSQCRLLERDRIS